MNDQPDLRLGLLGAGAIAQVVHLPILAEIPGVRVEGICDVDRAKATTIAGRFGIPTVYQSDDEILAADDLDGVIICTPSYLHEPQTVQALEAGKHVLVEKPLAFDADGAQRAVDAAERAARALVVALNNRFRPDSVALKPFTHGGELGRVFLVKTGSLNRKTRTVRPTWRHRRRTAGGGALMDLGVQALDLCLWLLDYPRARRLVAHVHAGEAMEVEDAAAVLLELEGGPVISMEVTWSLFAQRDRHYVQLLGTLGSASLPPLSVTKELDQGLVDVTPLVPAGRTNLYTTSYWRQLEHFLDAIRRARRGAARTEPPHDQVDLMRLISLAYRSAEEGREVEA